MRFSMSGFLLLGLCLNGCLDLRMDVAVKADRSVLVSMRMQVLEQFFQAALSQMRQSGQPVAFFEEASFRAKIEGDGGKLNRFENRMEKGMRTLVAEIYLADLTNLPDTLIRGEILLQEQSEVIKLTLFDALMGAAFGAMGQEQIEQQVTLMRSLMSGFKMDLRLSVPRLVDTNLTRVNQQSARYAVDFDRDIATRSGQESIRALRSLMVSKWLTFKLE